MAALRDNGRIDLAHLANGRSALHALPWLEHALMLRDKTRGEYGCEG